MNKTTKEIKKLTNKKVRMNDNTQKIWKEIDGSIIYYVEIGSKGDFPSAIIEDREGIAYKKVGNSLFFIHEKTKIEIPITEELKIGEYPGGSEKIPDCLGINIHSPDWRTVASIEFSAGKTDKYYKKLRKK